MRDALDAGELAHIEERAHRMIGAAGALGMHAVCGKARDVYTAARTQDSAALRNALAGLESAVDEWKDA